MALTALVPVFGAAVFIGEASGRGLEGWSLLPDLALLFVAGALFHVFGFVLNEWADMEVDRASRDLTDKPLVSGRVSPREALAVALGCALLCYVPMALVTREPLVLFVLTMSILMGAAYDMFGKRVPLDVLLAGSITLLLLAGALASGEFDLGSMRHWTLFGCLGALQFLQNLFQNAIEGGIKDADHDAAAGARTFAVVTGVRIVEGELVPTGSFRVSAAIIKAVHAAVLIYTVTFVVEPGGSWEGMAVLVLAIVVTVGMLSTVPLLLRRAPFDRSRLKRLFAVHEVVTFLATVVVFMPIIGYIAALVFFALPFLWFVVANTMLFESALEPGV